MDNGQKTDFAIVTVWALIAATVVVPVAICNAVAAYDTGTQSIPLTTGGMILGCFSIYKFVQFLNSSRSNPPPDAP